MEEQKTDRVGEIAAKLTGQVDEPNSSSAEAAGNFTASGWILTVIGVLIAGYALFGYEATAPYSDTLNIGLLNEQLILAISGWALFIAGIILIGISGIVRRL